MSADIPAFSYNTAVAAFMICVNELSQAHCTNKALLSKLVVALAPFAPHIAEELWAALGNSQTVCDAQWPAYEEKYLEETEVQLAIAFNGKARFQMAFPATATNAEIEQAAMADERAAKFLEGKQVVKVIVVPKKIVNIVVKG